MKPADVRKKSRAELTKLLTELESELRVWHFEMAGGRVKNVRHARTLRADIARIKTALGQAMHA